MPNYVVRFKNEELACEVAITVQATSVEMAIARAKDVVEVDWNLWTCVSVTSEY